MKKRNTLDTRVDEVTVLAKERTLLAEERTYLAIVRTVVAILAVFVALFKFMISSVFYSNFLTLILVLLSAIIILEQLHRYHKSSLKLKKLEQLLD
ncbi:MAG: DUF202 domain-containing protein [Nanoarchaeota archaeon]|nr:DUF202 domain-containing protein [Nanoarchaeota archaeon]MBU1030299.1 DUF202 domain-containing protein [Nanoarchaeota archaeon]MBU1849312.1 DUF202 domain-containing protein [Nanoarchaeota archaeon]